MERTGPRKTGVGHEGQADREDSRGRECGHIILSLSLLLVHDRGGNKCIGWADECTHAQCTVLSRYEEFVGGTLQPDLMYFERDAASTRAVPLRRCSFLFGLA